MRRLVGIIGRVAATDSSVLIAGATGTGKELIARTVHELSRRRDEPFVDINCSAVVATLFEAELFGHERGTFTGAFETRRGLFEQATGGTIFLDEVDTLDLASQSKLLRVLQERQVRRVGGRENIPINVRIVAATNCDLKAAVAKGAFRADLFYRLRVIPLHVPNLSERRDDIVPLVEQLILRVSERMGVQPRRFSAKAMRALTAHDWPGNVRELENAIEYALGIGETSELGVDDLPPDILKGDERSGGHLGAAPFTDAPLEEMERRYILTIFERHNQHQIKTAEALGIDRRTLYRKLRQYGVLQSAASE
jgi:DNA-binding NtrC family response regulator